MIRLMVAIMIGFLLTSCKMGIAVVIWPPEESNWETGDLVVVKDDSFLRKTYIVNIPNQRRIKEEIKQWRLKLFRTKIEAQQWSNSLAEWQDVYAKCTYQGLPMREEPNNRAKQLYRFREGEISKVLDREPGPVDVGNLQGYWYKVMANGGTEGYIFDYHLQIIRKDSNEDVILNTKVEKDPLLEKFLSKVWRPQYFAQMISRDQINLNLFRPEYGIFIDVENKQFAMNTVNRSLKQTWTEIVPLSSNRYKLINTDFWITIHSETSISVQFNVENKDYFENFVYIDADLDEYIQNEILRQRKIIETLISQGPVYRSHSYGKLAFTDGNRFNWSEKSSLIARDILSLDTGNTGQIRFKLSLDELIRDKYDGVLTLQFDNGETVHFLYSFKSPNLNLTYVHPNTIENGIVYTDQYFNPVRIFFRSQGGS